MGRRSSTGAAIGAALALFPAIADAGTQTAFFDSLNGAASLAAAVNVGDTVFLDSLVTAQTGALSQSIGFTLGAGVTSVTGAAGWMVSPIGAGPRLIGVNIDIRDASNAVVATDSFAGVLGNLASSTFSANLGPGSYTMTATGTGIAQSLLDVALIFGGTAGGGGAPVSGSVPAQGATAPTPTVFFDQLTDTRGVTPTLGAGDTLIVDSLVTTETGALSQTVEFTLASGVDGLSGQAAWIVSPGDTGPRLIGVNIDVFDASNVLVGSDSFAGVLATFARSTFDIDLGPGTYRLVATGTGVRDASLDIALNVGGVPVDVPVGVPEPGTLALLAFGIGGFGMAMRRRRIPA